MTQTKLAASPGASLPPAQRLDYLDAVRAFAILCVVAIHAKGYALPMDPATASIVDLIVHQAAVPLFFLVDGWLMAHSALAGKQTSYPEMLRSSARRLLLPWLLFTVAYGLARYLFERFGVLDSNIIFGATAPDVVIAAWGSVYSPQLYFLVSLFLIRLLTPLHRTLTLRCGFLALLGIAAGYALFYRAISPWTLALLDMENGQEPLLHALYNYQYYLLGMALRKLPESVSPWPWALGLLALYGGACVFFWTGGAEPYPNYIKFPYLVGSLLLASTGILNSAPVLWLGRNTMPLFLLHLPILLKVSELAAAPLTDTPFVSFLLAWLFSIALSLLVLWILRKLPYHELLFGETRRTARSPAQDAASAARAG
jgi:fucose 4-O-acetylase-like acetyltransferase